MQIEKDRIVSIGYKLTDDNGKLIEQSSEGKGLNYLHGSGNIIPGLERELEGRKQGEELSVTIPPDQAYGQRNDELVQQVPRSAFDSLDKLDIGMRVQAQDSNGRVITLKVVDIQNDQVTVDGNHPLAGQNLHFDIRVLDVREATSEEIDHGHPHA